LGVLFTGEWWDVVGGVLKTCRRGLLTGLEGGGFLAGRWVLLIGLIGRVFPLVAGELDQSLGGSTPGRLGWVIPFQGVVDTGGVGERELSEEPIGLEIPGKARERSSTPVKGSFSLVNPKGPDKED